MELIDNYGFKVLRKLAVSKKSTFTDLGLIINNKRTRSNRLKFLIDKKLIFQKDRIYELTEKGTRVTKLLKEVNEIINREKIHENLNHVPYLFQNYLFSYLTTLKECFNDNLLSIILFGSISRGKWTKESDIDLFIIFTNEILKNTQFNQKLTSMTIEFEKKTELVDERGEIYYCPIQEFSLALKDLNNFRTLFYDIGMDGLIIYDKNDVGFKFLKEIRQRIIKKGLKRVFINEKDFYWKRKKIKFGEIIEL